MSGHDEWIRDTVAVLRASGLSRAWWEYHTAGPNSATDFHTWGWFSWVRLLKRGHRNPGVLDVVVEAVIGKWFTLPGLHHNLQRFVKASPLLPGCKIEPLEFVFQIAGTNPEDKPATSHLIKHSILFGSRKRLVKRQYGDRNAQSDLLRSLGSSS